MVNQLSSSEKHTSNNKMEDSGDIEKKHGKIYELYLDQLKGSKNTNPQNLVIAGQIYKSLTEEQKKDFFVGFNTLLYYDFQDLEYTQEERNEFFDLAKKTLENYGKDNIETSLIGKFSNKEDASELLKKLEDNRVKGDNTKYYLFEETYTKLPEFHIYSKIINSLEFKKEIDNLFINNQNPNIMETQKEFNQLDYLKNQIKYLGFGEDEKLHIELEKGINSKKQQFEIKTTSDKTLPGNKAEFLLLFNKTESGGVFLNAYDAKLTTEKGDEIGHNFRVNRENSFTAKEAVNLLEGRSVKIEFHNPKSDQKETAFVQFNFDEPKTEKGNYLFQNFYQNYGVDTEKIVEKSNLVFDKPEYKDNVIKSLEKGNIVKVKFQMDDNVIEGKAILDPQNRNLKLYDNDMNRLNTNKPLEGLEQENKHEKNNVKEQSIKR